MTDYKKIWDEALLEIEIGVSKANFSTWFKNTYISKQEEGTIYINVPSAFVKDWLQNKYHKLILKALREIIPDIRGVEYIIQKDPQAPKEITLETENKSVSAQLKFNEPYVNREDNLNPRYVFDGFIVGPFNELAYAAAQAVIKNPGSTYNPLYIYGGTGLGKTHLIQAIGNHIKKSKPNSKVFYLASERYVTEIINSITNNTINITKEKYKKYDALIIDDVQFFSKKDKVQEEMFHLFNDFYNNNKQIIFSSDKPPKYIQDLEERLRSRFEGGMIVDISKPEYESKVSDVKTLLKNNSRQQKSLSIKDIVRIIAEFYNVEEKHLYEKTRKREVVKPRQIAMYILRENYNSSYPQIGEKLGGRDHTTVMHACEKIKEDIKKSDNLMREIDQIKTLLFGPESRMSSAVSI
ncbi:MAG: Chromosomal replication initiator protein DnaA [Candidatus Moranbacteria bacterium GW2011_GWF1_35_5]|nr:MAG: Chromosomal replication initiator protein DnaA [Candidatus Moranbacteria bacterium GW2011_GWF1_35_5]